MPANGRRDLISRLKVKELTLFSSSQSVYNKHIFSTYYSKFYRKLGTSGFGGLEVACWPLVPKFAGSNLAEAVEFLRVNKSPQHVGEHGCLSVVTVVCCQVEFSATN